MRVHDLKCLPVYFQAVIDEEKKFEIRKNDRDFRVGDLVTLTECSPYDSEPTGRRYDLYITYIFYGGAYGLDQEYCIFNW